MEQVKNEEDNVGSLSVEEVNELVLENKGWAESIARSVARAWGLDWKLDGLDGAVMEGLIFCARRYDPKRGVPFRAYARKRIHEAATEAARSSKGWKRYISRDEERAREVSLELLNIFPELRAGELPFFSEEGETHGEEEVRVAIRHLLMGATLIVTREGLDAASPDQLLEYKRLISVLGELEPLHQHLLWKVYWEGVSLRSIASEWETEGLNVIREHKAVIDYLYKNLSLGKRFLAKPRVRPGLKHMAQRLKNSGDVGPFCKFLIKGAEDDEKNWKRR